MQRGNDMLIYGINLALVLVLGVVLCEFRPKKWKKILYLAVTFGFMWFLATFRDGMGYDYQAYINIFIECSESSWGGMFQNMRYEPGFLILTKLMTYFVGNTILMYGIYTALILAPVAVFLYRYSDNLWLSTYLFVALTFFATSMNFVRQSIAASIILWCYPFLKQKKIVPYMLLVLLACSFHYTAVIMVPVYFFAQIRLSKGLMAFYGVSVGLLYLFSEQVLTLVTKFAFRGYVGTFYLEEGLEPLHMIVPVLVFAFVMMMNRSMAERFDERDVLLLTNFALFSLVIWLFITKHFILERFSIYVYQFVMISIPMACSCFKPAPDLLAYRDSLLAEAEQSKGKEGKNLALKLRECQKKIKTAGSTYYGSAAICVLATIWYYVFGLNDGIRGFHGIAPYLSMFDWLTRLP